MARKQKGQKTPNFSLHAKSNGSGSSKGKKLESYEDTLEPGSTDEHIYRRDQIFFNPQDESDGDDDMGPEGEEVLSLNLPRRKEADEEDDTGDYVDEEEMPAPPKSKAEKKKEDLKTKGRFGKPIESSDDEDLASGSGSGSGSGSEDEDEQGWGRSYYSRPSTRREKEELRGEYDEKKEEDRELELKEVKRMQRKSREKLAGDDWGLVELEDVTEGVPTVQKEEKVPRTVAPTPKTSDPVTLIRHLESNEPVKLALARDLPLTIRTVEKTARGIKKMMAEEEGHGNLHKGLGWLHYQSLLTYATTLAFYVHLAALPASERPDLADHPIIPRLFELKKAVTDLQELDFAAGSVSDGDPLVGNTLADELDLNEDGEIDLSTDEKKLAFMDLLNKMREADGSGVEVMDEDEEDEDDEDDFGDFDDSWKVPGLEEDELDDLLADANGEDVYPDTIKKIPSSKKLKVKSTTKDKKTKTSTESEDGSKKKRSRKPKPESATPVGNFTPLPEPAFYSSASTKSKSKGKSTRPSRISADDDTLGDATALLDADASDKERRTKSLRFHTSKIASQSARRAAARAQRAGGDDDVPRRDRQKARDAALRKNSANSQDGGEDLNMDGDGPGASGEWSESEKKRAREVREDGPEEIDDGANDYYDLVKRRKTERQAEKEEAHEDRRAEKFASFEEESADGPRALTRAIEKNRGLTPRRNKTGRNPRVKKRMAYEKAKQKVGSQRAVYKGGQATVGGNYSGEKTGISTVVKSRKF